MPKALPIEFYLAVAREYEEIIAAQGRSGALIEFARRRGVSRKETAFRWIQEARRLGLLDPPKRNKTPKRVWVEQGTRWENVYGDREGPGDWDWPQDLVEADTELIAQAKDGRISACGFGRSTHLLEDALLEIDLAAWKTDKRHGVTARDREESWIDHRRNGCDSDWRELATPNKAPPSASTTPPEDRREEWRRDERKRVRRALLIIGRIEGLAEAGLTAEEIAERTNQPLTMVRHHLA